MLKNGIPLKMKATPTGWYKESKRHRTAYYKGKVGFKFWKKIYGSPNEKYWENDSDWLIKRVHLFYMKEKKMWYVELEQVETYLVKVIAFLGESKTKEGGMKIVYDYLRENDHA